MATKCVRCRKEFGIFLRERTCLRCGSSFCAEHFLSLPDAEARRRFRRGESLQPKGHGLCVECNASRSNPEAWAREPNQVPGATIFFHQGDGNEPFRTRYRFATHWNVTENETRVLLVPLRRSDTRIRVAKLDAGGLGFDLTVDASAVVPATPEPLWTAQDVSAREALVRELSDSKVPADGAKLARWAHDFTFAEPPDIARAGLDPTTGTALMNATGLAARILNSAAGLSMFGLGGMASLLQTDEALLTFRNDLAAAGTGAVEAAARELRTAARDLLADANRVPEDDPGFPRAAYRASTAQLILGLLDPESGSLRDAARGIYANPWAVALWTVRTRDTLLALEAVQRMRQCPANGFPWSRLLRRIIEGDSSRWWARPMSVRPIPPRLGQGAVKEVWHVAGVAGRVVCVAREGAAARDGLIEEVELLQAVTRKFGEVGERLGLPPILDRGTVVSGGRNTVAYCTNEFLPFRVASPQFLQKWTDWVRLGRDLATALSHIHAVGYAHGDVKPDNLLFTTEGCVVLADFGAAARLGDNGEARAKSWTPEYAAPEQIHRQVLRAASDVYAAAKLVAVALARNPDAPARTDASRGHALWNLLDAAQSPDPERRPDAAKVSRQLDLVLSGTPVASSEGPQVTRLAALLTDAQRRVDAATTSWPVPPSPALRKHMYAAATDLRLCVSHQATVEGAYAKSVRGWIDAARIGVDERLLTPWASQIAGEREGLLRDLAAVRAHSTTGAAQAIDALARSLHGQGTHDISLSRCALFMVSENYGAIRSSWNNLLKSQGHRAGLKSLHPHVRDLGELRNSIEHRGRAGSLSVQDLERTEARALLLLGLLHGTQPSR